MSLLPAFPLSPLRRLPPQVLSPLILVSQRPVARWVDIFSTVVCTLPRSATDVALSTRLLCPVVLILR